MKKRISSILFLLALPFAVFAEDPPAVPKSTVDPSAAAIEKAFAGGVPPEAARMLLAILNGSQMQPGDGWFGPSESRYTWEWLAKLHGLDAKATSIPKSKFAGSPELFAKLDRNRDGSIKPEDLDWSENSPYVQLASTINRIYRRLDAKSAGQLTREQWLEFFDKAVDGKSFLTANDLSGALLAGYSGSFSMGDAPNKDILIRGFFAGEIGSFNEGPKVDQPAPNFTLKTVAGDKSIELAKLFGEKPVVLITGNFTCGPFRSYYPAVDELYTKYKDKAHFLMVYVREAHPTDGWKMFSNSRAGVSVAQPKTFAERATVAGQFCTKLNPNVPVVVDDVNDAVGHAYSGMPARLYVIDRTGTVAYKSGRGPFGFKPGELEQALVMSLVEQTQAKPADPKTATRPALVSDREAWAKMPKATIGGEAPLPNWAKAVVPHLPRTAAAMLVLDHAQRTKSPLDPSLRAKMRWVVAHSNRCRYAEDKALLDLKTATGSDSAGAVLRGDSSQWSADDRAPLEFARLLTVSAHAIPDELFDDLRKKFGDKKTAAMVLLAAYGNFQDRFLLGLGVPLEEDGPRLPLAVTFAAGAFQSAPLLPEQHGVPKLLTTGENVVPLDNEWSELSYGDLQSRLAAQKNRTPRLPIPTWDEVKKGLPPEFTSKPTRILWNLVCSGYVPELAVPWATSTRTMWAESQQDRVFEESLFWIQTRSVRCNYCMGHCEMLLEVAGLDKSAVTERTKRLASNDWSSFPTGEQRAYAYARKLTKTPWDLTAADYVTLEKDLGADKAMFTFWWLCRGLYMTRVSDGFQLPLESENVFGDLPLKK